MNHWDIKIIRAAVLHDIRGFIPANHYQNASTSVQHGVIDGTMGIKLFFSTNPEMSARQYAACEVLIWLGMYTANHDVLEKMISNKLETHPEYKSTYAQLAGNEKSFIEDLTVCVRRYGLHLPETEAKPLLSFVADNPSKKTKPEPGGVKDRLSFLENTDRKLNEYQEDARDFLRIAKKLWDQNPKLNRTQIRGSPELVRYGKKYVPMTLFKWLKDIDPRPAENRVGRPHKNSPRP